MKISITNRLNMKGVDTIYTKRGGVMMRNKLYIYLTALLVQLFHLSCSNTDTYKSGKKNSD